MTHTWEKGGSGLVFYTDDVFWEAHDGEREELMADDWHADEAQPVASSAAAAADFHRAAAWRRHRESAATLRPRRSERARAHSERRGAGTGAGAGTSAGVRPTSGGGGSEAIAVRAGVALERCVVALDGGGGGTRGRKRALSPPPPPPPPLLPPPPLSSSSAAAFGVAVAVREAGFGGFERHTRGVGLRVLARSGWRPGEGLGKRGQGRAVPLKACERHAVEGLGWRPGARPAAARSERAAAAPSAAPPHRTPAPYMPAAGAPLQGPLLVDQPSRSMLFGGMLLDAAAQ